jgi:hypothetical protein
MVWQAELGHERLTEKRLARRREPLVNLPAMLVRKPLVGVAIGVLVLLAVAIWVAQPRQPGRVQLLQVIHTDAAGVPQPGWFMVSNPLPCHVMCIPMSIQARSATGWVNVMTMSPTNDPFTYDFRSFPSHRVLTQQESLFFTPKMAVSNGVWRVTVHCTERTSRDRFNNRLSFWIWKLFPRNGVLAQTYGGRSYELSSSPREEGQNGSR